MASKYKNKKVAVILGFYNGNDYIDTQVKSILEQEFKNIDIYIFDDNSTLNVELKKIKSDKNTKCKIKIFKRERNVGYAKNFLLGLKEAGNNYDFYAFSDQDDIWELDKINRGVEALNSQGSNLPKLYCSRTAYFNSDCSKQIGSSKIHTKKPTFANALLQNIAGGNTIIMNKLARKLVIKTVKAKKFISHDWWCYLIISGSGGMIIFDDTKTVKYRQHKKNLIGMNIGFKNQKSRLLEFASGKVKNWLDSNSENLNKNKSLLTKHNLKILYYFSKARRSKSVFKRLLYLYRSGVYRQSFVENVIFTIGIIFKKI
ncbi:MAG: glycosyltransferase [Prochlorococcus marinus CUG1436]|nr:glycosyltransferase [Prochlorococcus marinus CUG1436]